MQNTPRGIRLHIGIFGKRNVGKSSILNSLTGQNISIVSEIAGTTTDPVEKAMELLPLGPVVFVDTAGIDDEGDLGQLRVNKTYGMFDRIDIAVLVVDNRGFDDYEKLLVEKFKSRKIPYIVVLNKSDYGYATDDIVASQKQQHQEVVVVSSLNKKGIDELKQSLINLAPDEFINTPSIASDLLPAGEVAVLVVPIDLEAPKGRLILPQVQTIRELLDNDNITIVAKERELKEALNRLNKPPSLVITDSQAFLKVSADVPKGIMLTSFSILFARFKGELNEFVRGATAIEHLKTGDKVLICESCTHHSIGDDIGRVKIPRWLTQFAGGKLEFVHYSGHDFPENLEQYKLIVHCGACMTNRREVLSRIIKAKNANVPITNYGLAIAYSLGIFERALEPFPMAKQIYEESKL